MLILILTAASLIGLLILYHIMKCIMAVVIPEENDKPEEASTFVKHDTGDGSEEEFIHDLI